MTCLPSNPIAGGLCALVSGQPGVAEGAAGAVDGEKADRAGSHQNAHHRDRRTGRAARRRSRLCAEPDMRGSHPAKTPMSEVTGAERRREIADAEMQRGHACVRGSESIDIDEAERGLDQQVQRNRRSAVGRGRAHLIGDADDIAARAPPSARSPHPAGQRRQRGSPAR